MFVNTVTVAKELGETLHAALEEAAAGAGEDREGAAPRPIHVIHKEIPAYLRSEALAAFKGEPDAVLVRPARSPVVLQELRTKGRSLWAQLTRPARRYAPTWPLAGWMCKTWDMSSSTSLQPTRCRPAPPLCRCG